MKTQESVNRFSPQDSLDSKERYLGMQRRNEEMDRLTNEIVRRDLSEVSEQYALQLDRMLNSLRYSPF